MENQHSNKQTNQEVLEDYMLHLNLANRSENTLETYVRLLERFLSNVSVPIQAITSEQVLDWLKENGEYRAETTLSTWISILSSFFTFCENEGYIPKSPMKSRWRPLLPKPLPRYLEKEEFAKLKLEAGVGNLRDQALFEFLSSSGCRISETLMLNKEDINLKDRTAVVKGKGNKLRTIHFNENCSILLEKLLAKLPEDTSGVFLNHRGGRLTRSGAHGIIHEMGNVVGLKSAMGPHRLRHTFATRLLSKGADLSFISKELGHSKISTTQVYARLPKEELISMYRKFLG